MATLHKGDNDIIIIIIIIIILTLEQATKAQRGSRGIAPPFL